MPIIQEDDFSSAAPAAKPTPGKGGIIQEDEMSGVGMGRALAGVPERVGLNFISAGGGILEGLGDLVRSETLSDLGREVGKTARGARADVTPSGMSLGEQVVAGGAESALTMLPAMPLTGARMLVGGLGTAMGQAWGDRYGELRDQNFSGGKAGFHASVNALAEGVGEFVGLKVLSDAARPWRNKIIEFMKRDLVGEEFTTAVQALEAKLSDQPDMTLKEFMDQALMTALVAPVGSAMQGGMAAGFAGARTALAPKTEQVAVEPTPAAPGPTPEGAPQPQPEAPQPTDVLPPTPPGPTPEGAPDAGTETPPQPDPTDNAPPAPQPSAPQPPAPTPDAGTTPPSPGPSPGPTPPPPGPSTSPGYASIVELTPDEMLAQSRFDPELYNGVRLPGGDIAEVRKRPDGKWEASIYDGAFLRSYTTAAEAIDDLRKRSGVDITRPEELKKRYDVRVLDHINQHPDSILDLSDGVSKYFGGMLEQIAPLTEERNQNLGASNRGPFGTQFVEQLASFEREQMGISVIPSGLRVVGAPDLGIAPTSMKQLTRHTWIGPNNDAMSKRMAAYVEQLRKRWLPDVGIVMKELSPKQMASGTVGATSPIGTDVYTISLRPEKLAGKNPESVFQTVAHEFGHIVMMQHFRRAPPEVKAKLFKAFLEYTKGVKLDDNVVQYTLEHHADTRGQPTSAQHFKHASLRASGAQYTGYLMSFSEYVADQAAYYFLHRETVKEDNSPGADTTLKAWFDAMIAQLQQYFQAAVKKFKPNLEFYDWLDSLAGPPTKVSGQPPKTKDKPPGDPNTAKPNIFPPTEIKTPEQAKKLAEIAGRILEMLHAAGATKQEIDALSPTGLIKDFDFIAAKALADKYGIDPWYYKNRLRLDSLDDTFGLRTELFSIARADPEVREVTGQAAHDLRSFNWFLQRTMTAVQIRKRFGQVIPGVKNFVDNLERMFNYRSKWKEQADKSIEQMKEVPKALRKKIFDIMLEEDKSGEWASNITQGPAGQQIHTLKPETIKKWGLDVQGGEKAVALYTRLRNDFASALVELENEATRELERIYPPGPALGKALAELHAGFNAMKARPYVPHTRFGKHTVSVRDSNGVLIEFYQFEYKHSAENFEKKRREQGGGVVSRGVLTEQMQMMMGMPPALINAMKHHLHLDESQIAAFEDILKDMSHGASFVRRFKRRKDIKGWADDADQFPRAYADYMSRFANHVSRLRYNWQLSGNVQEVRAQAVDMAKLGVNTEEVNSLGNWLDQLQDYVNKPGIEWANARAAATIWYLGFNVKSAVVNATSVPMVTVPYLSKRYGWDRAFAATTQAYKDVAKMYMRMQALTEDERLMLEQLRSDNKIDASFASELAGLREGGRLTDQTSLGTPQAAGFALKHASMWMFQKMEVANRHVTALAAYRLARTQKTFPQDGLAPGYDVAAFNEAGKSIQDTQNENAQWNRAEFARGRKGILTMFMSYQQNLLYQMFGGDESWMRLLAVQFMMAGMMGLPFAQDADELIKWFSRRVFGSDVKALEAARAWLLETIGPGAEWFLRGASHNFMGTGLDISGSLSQGRAIPGVDALAAEGRFADKIANAASDVGGAGIAAVMKVIQAANSNDPDLWKRAASAMPEVVRSGVEGLKMFESGVARDRQGNTIAQVSPEEALMRGLGFQITDVVQERNKRFAAKDTAAFWIARRQHVLALYQLAQEGDSDWMGKANEALREFNRDAPAASLKITRADIQSSIIRRAKSRARTEAGLGPNRVQDGIYQEKAKLYPAD